jgi:hypothetical protein
VLTKGVTINKNKKPIKSLKNTSVNGGTALPIILTNTPMLAKHSAAKIMYKYAFI